MRETRQQGQGRRAVLRRALTTTLGAAALLGVAAVDAAGQVIPRDTLPRDTVRAEIPPGQVASDTLPALPEVPDSMIPAPVPPSMTVAVPTGAALGVWEWSRDELQRHQTTSLLEFLLRVPGLGFVRAGQFGAASGGGPPGLGGGRLRVFRDGFELDPLLGATPELQELPLSDVQSLRVVRLPHEVRVELSSFRLVDRRPYSQVEAATGTPVLRLLRGIFSRPVGTRNLATVGFDLVDFEGYGDDSPFTLNSGYARWSYLLRPDLGFQAEYRQAGVQRDYAPFWEDGSRRELSLQALAQPVPGLTLQAIGGQIARTPSDADSTRLDLSVVQAALRAAYERGPVWGSGGVRYRSGDERGYPTPDLELSAQAGLRATGVLSGFAEVRSTTQDEVSGTELAGSVRVGPFAGFSLFGSVAAGTRAVGLRDSTLTERRIANPRQGEENQPDSLTVTDTAWVFPARAADANGLRAGAEWSARGITVGGALLRSDGDFFPFGQAFDAELDSLPRTAGATGFEVYGSVPLLWQALRAEGWFTRWSETGNRPYLPTQEWYAALEYHDLYYTGNLEPTLRLEARSRGQSLVPDPETSAFAAINPAYTTLNVYFQLRVIDVRAYLLFENVLGDELVADLPGRVHRSRLLYGVRWHFRN